MATTECIRGGTSGSAAEVGVGAQAGIHSIAKPQAFGALGHYSIGAVTGAIAAGAGADSHVFQARWTHASNLALIHEITIPYIRCTTAFAAGDITVKLDMPRAWTVDGTGGTALTLTTNNQKLRTSMGTTLFGTIRIATTAALGAGTSTLDAQPLNQVVLIGNVTANSIQNTTTLAQATGMGIPLVLFKADIASGEHPIVLATNEGIAVRITVPGTGVWTVAANMKWSEVTAF